VYHKRIYRDRADAVRADLRTAALHDWESLPVDGRTVWLCVGPTEGVTDPVVKWPPARVAGLVADIAVGSTPDHLLFGTRGGGVWHSTNAGSDWAPRGDSLPSLQTVTAALVDGGPDPILLAGSGELSNEQVRNAGLMGFFRSVDGGKTWSVADGGLDATIFQSHDINQIVALDADRILVATRVGLFYSKDGGRNFGQEPDHVDGLPVLRGFVSAVVVDGNDVGAVVSGEKVGGDPVPDELRPQLATPAEEPGLYGSTLSPTTLPNLTRLHRTLDRVPNPLVGQTALARRGASWLMSVATVGVDFTRVDAYATWPHHSVQYTQNDPALNSGWGALSIAVLRAGKQKLAATWYAHTVALEPSPPGPPHAWFGTVDLLRLRILLSAGKWTWSLDPAGARGVHADQHDVEVVQPAPGTVRVLVGGDGGFYQTEDSGATFTEKNKQGAFLFWSLAVARKDPTTLRLVGGLQDNQSVIGEGKLDGSAWTWNLIFTGGDGGNAAFVPSARNLVATEDPQQVLLTMNGMLFSAQPNGPGWKNDEIVEANDTPGLPKADFGGGVLRDFRFSFSETVVVARCATGDWDRVYFSCSQERNGPGTLRTRDGWAGSFDVKRTFPEMVTAMAAAPEDVATELFSPPREWAHLWVGLADGTLLFSPDAGTSFVPTPTGGTGPVTGIAVDPQDSRRVAVVHGGFAGSSLAETSRKVFLTEDRGAQFRDISGPRGPNGFVPDVPALGVAFSRTSPAQLIVATDLGVLATTGPQFGNQWVRLGLGLPKLPCTGIGVVNDNPTDPVPAIIDGVQPLSVAVATFGRGVWVLTHSMSAQAFVDLDGGFGPVHVGATARRTVTVYNVGGAALDLTAASVPAPFAFDGLPALPLSIAPGDKASWSVTCSPTAAGIETADLTLTFSSGGPAEPPHVSCEAVSTGPPRLALWPRSIDFGNVKDGESAQQTVHLANRGAKDLTITGITAAIANSAELALDPVAPPNIVLAPGEERALTLRFNASGGASSHEAAWTIASDDPIAIPDYWSLAAKGNVVAAATEGLAWYWWVLIGVGIGAAAAGAAVAVYEETKPKS
jgi:hypothetical protein